LAEGAVNEWVAAEEHMSQALTHDDDPWISMNRTALEGNLASMREHLGGLEVTSNVTGASWALDGEEMGTLPMSRSVRAAVGLHVIEVRASGYQALRQPIEIRRGVVERQRADLAQVAAAAPAVLDSSPALATERATRIETPRAPTPLNPVVVPAPPATASTTMRGWGIGLTASGGVLVVGGLIAYGSGVGVASVYNENVRNGRCLGNSFAEVDRNPTWCSSDQTSARLARDLSVAGYVGGGILAGIGIVLLIAAPPRHSTSARDAVRCGSGPGELGISCGGSF